MARTGRSDGHALIIITAAIYGMAAAVLIALTAVHFVRALHELPLFSGPSLSWAVFVSAPWGPAAGALAGGYWVWRSQCGLQSRRLAFETSLVAGIVGILAVQAVIPVAWDLPRIAITSIVGLTAAPLGLVGALVLTTVEHIAATRRQR